MAGKSKLSPRMIAKLTDKIMPDIFETLRALQNGGVTLVLGRYDTTIGDYIALPPQTVIFDYAARQERIGVEAAAEITTRSGTMTFQAPNDDVQAGDVFTITGDDGYIAGTVISVGPLELGERTATWELRTGGVS